MSSARGGVVYPGRPCGLASQWSANPHRGPVGARLRVGEASRPRLQTWPALVQDKRVTRRDFPEEDLDTSRRLCDYHV
jgi:hypothetical protein